MKSILIAAAVALVAAAALAQSPYAGLQTRGIKLRSRALTTTMFVRLFLADAFLHGIGGAKYDEVTVTGTTGFVTPWQLGSGSSGVHKLPSESNNTLFPRTLS